MKTMSKIPKDALLTILLAAFFAQACANGTVADIDRRDAKASQIETDPTTSDDEALESDGNDILVEQDSESNTTADGSAAQDSSDHDILSDSSAKNSNSDDLNDDSETEVKSDEDTAAEQIDSPDRFLLDVVVAVDAQNANECSDCQNTSAVGSHLFDALTERLFDFFEELPQDSDLRLAVIDGCADPAVFHDHSLRGNCLENDRNWLSSNDADFDNDLRCLMDFAPSGGSSATPDRCDSDTARSRPHFSAASALSHASDGFLRAEAALLVIVMTDRDVSLDGSDPSIIRSMLSDAKQGVFESVFFVGLGGQIEIPIFDEDCDSAYDSAQQYDIKDTPNLRSVVQRFGASGVFNHMCKGFSDEDPISTALNRIRERISQSYFG